MFQKVQNFWGVGRFLTKFYGWIKESPHIWGGQSLNPDYLELKTNPRKQEFERFVRKPY